jgi:hypothetical protein
MRWIACREKELIESMTDNECIPVMLGNVKLSMPGMHRAVQNLKKGRKAV